MTLLDWGAVLVVGLVWIEHYMDWRLRITKEMKK